MKTYEQILCEVEDHILTITINRPERHNAYTEFMRDEMIDALNDAYQDDDIRVIIFTGNPDGKNYCAGLDLSAGDSTVDFSEEKPLEHRDGGGMLALKLYESNKPVIAAINGAAAGVGFTMTLPMDFRIASTKSKFVAPFVRRGIMAESCCTYFLPRICGMGNAMKLVLTGKVITAQEALEMGLVTQLTEPENLMPTVRALALDIAQNCAPVSVAMVRRMMWQMMGAKHPMDAHEDESRLLQWITSQPDAAEGINSFLEKRPPQYSMSPVRDLPDFYPLWRGRTFRGE